MLSSISALFGAGAIFFMGAVVLSPSTNSYESYRKELEKRGFSPYEIEKLILRKKEIAAIKEVKYELKQGRIKGR